MSGKESKKNKTVVVLLSGGLDSSTVAYYVRRNEHETRIYTLTVDYGQRHRKELASACRIARAISSESHTVLRVGLTQWGGSSLTDNKIAVPVNGKLNAKGEVGNIPNTYVPGRNAILLALALSYAEAVGACEIYIGVNYVDYSGYVDCRPKFINQFQKLADVATVTSVIKGRKIKIKTPLINLTKGEIVQLGSQFGVDWSKTWSCYKGQKLACGKCDSCKFRLKGFLEAGIKDPIKYKEYPDFYKRLMVIN